MKRRANPYGNTRKRKAALAFMAERGITQPRALYPAARHVDVEAVQARAVPYIQFDGRARRLTSVS